MHCAPVRLTREISVVRGYTRDFPPFRRLVRIRIGRSQNLVVLAGAPSEQGL